MKQLTFDDAPEAEILTKRDVRKLNGTRRVREERVSIRENFERFHSANPAVYELLVRLARDVKNRGKSTYGMKAVFERARWHYHIERGETDFVLNNNYTAHYSRLIEEREPDLAGFFTKRRIRSL